MAALLPVEFTTAVTNLGVELEGYPGDKAAVVASIFGFMTGNNEINTIPAEPDSFRTIANALKASYTAASNLTRIRMSIHYNSRLSHYLGDNSNAGSTNAGSTYESGSNTEDEEQSGGYRKSYRKSRKYVQRRRTARRKQRRSRRHRA